MGKKKYLSEVEDLFKKSPVVSYGSIERIVKHKKNIKQYTKQLVRNLLLSGRIKRLTKGYYTSYDEVSLTVFCFKSSYLGLQDALSRHNLWEQETIPVILTTRKIRQGVRQVMGANVMIRRISSKYLFGFDYYKDGDFYLPYSDVEKTFIDMIYFKLYMDDELLKEFRARVDKKKLRGYLKNYGGRFRRRVLRVLG